MADLGEYYAATGGIAGAASVQHLLSIENPVDSSVIVVIKRLCIEAALTVLSTALFAHKAGRTTGVPTGGTTLTAVARDTTSPAASAVVRTGATATLAAGLIHAGSPGVVLGLAASGAFIPAHRDIFRDELDGAILTPGEAVLVVADANLTTWVHYVSVAWLESAR